MKPIRLVIVAVGGQGNSQEPIVNETYPSFGIQEWKFIRGIKVCKNGMFWSVTLSVLKKESWLQGKFGTQDIFDVENYRHSRHGF